jgi:hypothetical protein
MTEEQILAFEKEKIKSAIVTDFIGLAGNQSPRTPLAGADVLLDELFDLEVCGFHIVDSNHIVLLYRQVVECRGFWSKLIIQKIS